MTADGRRMCLSVHMSEGGSTLVAVDVNGQKQWGVGRINGGPTARSGDYLYMLAGGGHPEGFDAGPGQLRLVRLDLATGRFVAFADGKSEHVIAHFPADRPVKPRLPEGETVFKRAYDADWLHREALGMAALGDRLYVPMFFEGKILVVDPQKGTALGEIPLARPAGVAADVHGSRLLAVSGRQVVRIDPASRAVAPVVTAGLEVPLGLAADRRGNIYVSDWGGAMCVRVFSPQGKLLRTIGTPGGRPLAGPYDRQGMFRPWGLAIDAQDRLWVAEHDDTPRRFSVWSTSDGRLLDELCGPTWYGGTECAVNPLNPRQAFAMGNILELDWQSGAVAGDRHAMAAHPSPGPLGSAGRRDGLAGYSAGVAADSGGQPHRRVPLPGRTARGPRPAADGLGHVARISARKPNAGDGPAAPVGRSAAARLGQGEVPGAVRAFGASSAPRFEPDGG